MYITQSSLEAGMIKHIVMWRLKDEALGARAAENAERLQKRLEALKESIPEIRELEVGININPSSAASHVVLYSVFDSREDLEAYQKHPEHQKVAGFVGEIRSERRVVDYEV